MYTVRGKEGVPILCLENQAALKIINSTQGHFRNYQVSGNPQTKTVYELDEDATFTIPYGKLFLWNGTILIPD